MNEMIEKRAEIGKVVFGFYEYMVNIEALWQVLMI